MVALCTFGFIGKKAVDFLYCPVVSTDDKAMVVHIQDEVLALRGERERRERKSCMEVVDDSNNIIEIKLRKWYAI